MNKLISCLCLASSLLGFVACGSQEVGNENSSVSSASTASDQFIDPTVVVARVNAPDYAMADLTSITVETDVNNVVTSVSGSVQFIDGSHPGESYVIHQGPFSNSLSFAEVDADFTVNGTPTIIGRNPTIEASKLLNIGEDISGNGLTRVIIFRHAENGVPSYQISRLTFNHAP